MELTGSQKILAVLLALVILFAVFGAKKRPSMFDEKRTKLTQEQILSDSKAYRARMLQIRNKLQVAKEALSADTTPGPAAKMNQISPASREQTRDVHSAQDAIIMNSQQTAQPPNNSASGDAQLSEHIANPESKP